MLISVTVTLDKNITIQFDSPTEKVNVIKLFAAEVNSVNDDGEFPSSFVDFRDCLQSKPAYKWTYVDLVISESYTIPSALIAVFEPLKD